MTPCTQKLNAAKKKQFSKSVHPYPPDVLVSDRPSRKSKPVQLFATAREERSSDIETDSDAENKDVKSATSMDVDRDDENPF